jgi:hypothetical protein
MLVVQNFNLLLLFEYFGLDVTSARGYGEEVVVCGLGIL